jgi:hypothetical protein
LPAVLAHDAERKRTRLYASGMVARILSVAFVSVVLISLGVFVAYYAFELAFHFLDDD